MIIPLYNKEKYIKRAIQSVLSQTCQDFELIIVDDGSTDNSYQSAIDIQDSRIRIIRQENQGVSAARNRGVSEAKADWVAFLDADDEWLPEFLVTISNLMVDFPSCGIYATPCVVVNPDLSSYSPAMFLPYPKGWKGIIIDIFNDFRLCAPFYSSSIVVNREILRRIGGFPIGIVFSEDVITWMKIYLITSIAYINSEMAIYHLDVPDHVTTALTFRLSEYPQVPFLRNLLKTNNIPDQFKHSAYEYICKLQLIIAKRNAQNRNIKRALALLWECRFTHFYIKKWIKIMLLIFFPHILPKRWQ